DGLLGNPSVHVTADARTWLGFLAKEKGLIPALLTRKIRLKGNPKLLLAFGKCFPSAGPQRQRVEIFPEPSQMRVGPVRYQKNDPASGKIRWLGSLTVAEVDQVTHNVKTFRFRDKHSDEIPFHFLPGQFLTLRIAPGGIPVRRSYTIASSPTCRDRIEITVKREPHGLVSRWLHDELKVGDEVEVEAPNGSFVFDGQQAENVFLIGAGVGITPLMSVARFLTETGWQGKIVLIVGFRSPRDFIFRAELDTLQASNPHLKVIAIMSNPGEEPWTGRRGRIDAALLRSAMADLAFSRAHICGPPAMMESAKATLRDLGMPDDAIRTEAFGTVTREPAAKTPRSAQIAGTIEFQASAAAAPVPVGATVLEIAEELGVFIENACRSGTCGSCRARLVSGRVSMAVRDGLSDDDKEQGYILTCQAKVQGDVVVEA
ncbi:MAG: FAD-binding oxidoreductase, partial [Rudaea sp.]